MEQSSRKSKKAGMENLKTIVQCPDCNHELDVQTSDLSDNSDNILKIAECKNCGYKDTQIVHIG